MIDLPEGVKPPAAPQEPQRKSERSPETEKFQKEMHKKVEKVSETDTEQKKKRKRKGEAEEEEEPKDVASGPSTPKEHVTPFSLQQQGKKVSPLDMQKGGAISPLESAQPASLGAENTAAPFYAPPPPPTSEEVQDDAGLDTSYIEMPEEEIPSTSYTPPSFMPTDMPTSTSKSPQESQSTDDNPPDTRTSPPKKEEKSKKTQAKQSAPNAQIVPNAPPEAKKKGVTADELEKMVEGAPVESAGYFSAVKKETTPPLSKKEEAAIEGITPLPPLPPSDYVEKEKKKELETPSIAPLMQEPTLLPQAPPVLAAPEPTTPYALLHPHVMELFERMVGTMSVMHLSGVNETVINLNAHKFASSVFFGTQIIIKEYSSAPLAYNIQINGSSQALSLLERNSATLMAAFQHGNYAFRVHRLEPGLLEEKPRVRRKEPPAKGKEK